MARTPRRNGINRMNVRRAQWAQANLPPEVMAEVRKSIPNDAQDIRVMKRGNKYRVLFTRGGNQYKVYPWDVSQAGYRVFPGGTIQGHAGMPPIKIEVNPVISPVFTNSPHFDNSPVFNNNSNAGRQRRRRAVQSPVPERPFFNFEELAAQLQAKIGKRIKEEGVVPGAKEPDYKSRWTGTKPELDAQGHKMPRKETGIVQNVAHPYDNLFGKKVINTKGKGHKWYLIHPLALAEAMFSIKKFGWMKFRRDKKNYRKALALNERFAPQAVQLNETLGAEAEAALAELRNAVGAGRVTRENRNSYFEKYEKDVRDAEVRFQNGVTALTGEYMKEWNKK